MDLEFVEFVDPRISKNIITFVILYEDHIVHTFMYIYLCKSPGGTPMKQTGTGIPYYEILATSPHAELSYLHLLTQVHTTKGDDVGLHAPFYYYTID